MQDNQSLKLIFLLLLYTFGLSCTTSGEVRRTAVFWIERNGNTVALYNSSPSDDDCILATGRPDVLREISEDQPGRGEITFELERYPVFVPSYIAGEAIYDKPQKVRGQLVERMCFSDHLYWITRVRILRLR